MVTVRAMESLVAIAGTGSLTAAAAALQLSQPALSHQIRVLEVEVGAPVLERLPRGVRLTSVGESMLEAARTSVLAAARVVAAGREAAQGGIGTLRLACAESMTAGLLAPTLTLWRQQRPAVSVELIEHVSADRIADEVLSGAADLGVAPRPSGDRVRTRLLLNEPVQVVVSPSHPLASRSAVALWELRDEPFVHMDSSTGLAGWLDALAATAGVALRPIVRVRAASTAAALASSGLGVSVLPVSALAGRSDIISIPLDPPVSRAVVAMHRAGGHPLADAFCDLMDGSRPWQPAAVTGASPLPE